ncbi:MAG: 4-(cytidine 5'-diphospho)-2-C-methyl-D-erythritol kinase [Spirochaetota bacterium]
MKISIEAPCKINLFLDIIEKRPDGYHAIETAFHTIGLCDRISLKDAERTTLSVSGRYAALTGDPENNLIMKVYRFFSEEYDFDRPLAIDLEKNVPVGAGLGGGSSDAAHIIMALDRIGTLGLDAATMSAIAVRFGADVPFFINGGFAWGSGIGEVLTPYPNRLSGYAVIAYPRIAIATKDAYQMMSPADFNRGNMAAFQASLNGPVDKIDKMCYNIFQEVLLKGNDELARAKKAMERTASAEAHLSGSGSAFFFLFDTRRKATLVHHALTDGCANIDVFLAPLA